MHLPCVWLHGCSWCMQFRVLLRRALVAQLRNPTDVTARLLLSTYVGLLAGTLAHCRKNPHTMSTAQCKTSLCAAAWHRHCPHLGADAMLISLHSLLCIQQSAWYVHQKAVVESLICICYACLTVCHLGERPPALALTVPWHFSASQSTCCMCSQARPFLSCKALPDTIEHLSVLHLVSLLRLCAPWLAHA